MTLDSLLRAVPYEFHGIFVARCGRQVLLSPSPFRSAQYGVLCLDAEKCQLTLKAMGYDRPSGLDPHLIYKWLEERDPAIPIAPAPQPWSHTLDHAAVELIKAASTVVFCALCGQVVTPILQPAKRTPKPGSLYTSYTCPAGHLLIQAEEAHFYCASLAQPRSNGLPPLRFSADLS